MPLPKLSVILPTYNRAASLRRAVDALLRQDAPARSYEIVVVDNNSTDGTAALLSSMRDRRVTSVVEPRQGLSFARNAGIAAARAGILAFTDDDVEVAPDWVSIIVATLEARPDVDGAGGRVLPAWEGARPAWLTRSHWAPLALQDHGDEKRVFDRHTPLGLVGANIALRRAAFARAGLFSPGVQRVKDGIGSTEDHDLLTRVYAAGGRMLYAPRMLVLARVQPDRCEREYHRRWHQGHGRFHALMRLPEMEGSRFKPFGVPAHLVRAAARDAIAWVLSWIERNTEATFEAELRLRFFAGFVTARAARAGR
jgi:glycosyltransferase involved in cell wall biosynthesis